MHGVSTSSAQRKERAAHLGPERRRPLVLDTALQIAVEDGLAAVSIGAIASRMQVTRPVVYACYPDRISLLDALVNREAKLLLESTLQALHSATGDDPAAVFTGGYRALLSAVSRRPESWRVVFDANPDAEIAQTVADVRRVLFSASARWITPAMATWWGTTELERKTAPLIELFVSSCEAAVRILLDPANDWAVEDLAQLYGRVMAGAFELA